MALQEIVSKAMTGRQGCAVVLDGGNGRILACNDDSWAQQRTARPGSTVKPFTLSALVEAGIVNRKTTVQCRSPLRVAGRRLDCAHPANGVPLDPVTALAFSCNYYFATMASHLKPADLEVAFERAGLGVVRRALNTEQLQLQALGESSVEVTPLGLAQAYRKLAAGLDDLIRDGLLGSTEYGTGQLARRGRWQLAGKTGTATSRNGAWTHGWFAGFAPPERPAFVVVVFLEQGQGGLDAAPIAGAIFEGLS